MASELALGRSFYSWVTKITLKENAPDSVLPAYFSTKANDLLEAARLVKNNATLKEHKERAEYWVNIFEKLNSENNENIKRTIQKQLSPLALQK